MPLPRVADTAEYIAMAAPGARRALRDVRKALRSAVPEAEEAIGYRMPALRLSRNFLYYAAFTHHIGLYPPVKGDAALIKSLAPYRGPNGNLQFPLDKPMPVALIARVARSLAKEYAPDLGEKKKLGSAAPKRPAAKRAFTRTASKRSRV